MTKKSEINQTDFDRLLNWLDEDNEAAAYKYRSIHRRLVQIFNSRNALIAEELADQTIDRAIGKIDYLVGVYQGEPALYFYGIADKVFLEYARKPRGEPLQGNLVQQQPEEKPEDYYDCLNECLQSLLPEQRELFIDYFQHEKQTKIERHKNMAQALGVDINVIRTRIYRLRLIMEECVQKCVQKKNV